MPIPLLSQRLYFRFRCIRLLIGRAIMNTFPDWFKISLFERIDKQQQPRLLLIVKHPVNKTYIIIEKQLENGKEEKG